MGASGTGKSALAGIIEAAHRIDTRSRDGALALRAILIAVAEVLISERPRLIDQAPRTPGETLLLFCPTQGGWQTGEWDNNGPGQWISNVNGATLHPTHWAPLPVSPTA